MRTWRTDRLATGLFALAAALAAGAGEGAARQPQTGADPADAWIIVDAGTDTPAPGATALDAAPPSATGVAALRAAGAPETSGGPLITLYDDAEDEAGHTGAIRPLEAPGDDAGGALTLLAPAAAATTGDGEGHDGAPRGAFAPATASPLADQLPPPPPATADVTPEIVTAAVMDLAQALLADPATFAGSRLDSAQQERLRAFYAARQEPLWLRDGGWNEGARQTQARMERAWEEGLESADYPAPALAAGATPAALAEAEVRQSVNAVKYARDASGARIDPARLSRLLTPRRDLPDADRVLAGLAVAMQGGRDAGDALAAWNPSHAGYQALRARLIALRAARPPEPAVARIPHGPPLRVGMQDPRVKLVRSRLGLTPSDDVSYDERLAAAVAEFQRSRGLKPTGVLTRQTVLAMTGGDIPREEDESLLVVNMERWRWLPRDLGDDYVFVNIPEFRMRLVREGRLAFETRIIVGKPETPTPVFSHEIQYVVLNPYWTVPPSILKKEFLPALARDPQYAARRGYEVIRRGDRITVRQPPGERNALGRIKFMFPNDHAVYLHDTPNRGLFGRNRRAFSHGCVRVDDPLAFATLALGPEWPEQRIRRLLGKGERTVRLARPLPVHLAYFTASVDAGGTMHAREDIYGVDARMRAALARLRGAP